MKTAHRRFVIAGLLCGLVIPAPLFFADRYATSDLDVLDGFAWEKYTEALPVGNNSIVASGREAELFLALSEAEFAQLDSASRRFDFGTAVLTYWVGDRNVDQAIASASDDGLASASAAGMPSNSSIDGTSMSAWASAPMRAANPGVSQNWWPSTLVQPSATAAPSWSPLAAIPDDIVESGGRKRTTDLARDLAALGELADEAHRGSSAGINQPSFRHSNETEGSNGGISPRQRLSDAVSLLRPAAVAARDSNDSLTRELIGATEPALPTARELLTGASPILASPTVLSNPGSASAGPFGTPWVFASLPSQVISPTAIPEPQTIALLGMSLVFLGVVSWRRHR